MLYIWTFDRIFYLRLSFNLSDADLFGNSLAKIGSQLRALLLGQVNSRVSENNIKNLFILIFVERFIWFF